MIFSVHTLQTIQHKQTAQSSTKSVSFTSVRLRGCGECWELRFQLRVQERNANGLLLMDEDTFIYCLLAIECTVTLRRSSKLRIKTKHNIFPPRDSRYYVTGKLPFTPEIQDYDFNTVCICYISVSVHSRLLPSFGLQNYYFLKMRCQLSEGLSF